MSIHVVEELFCEICNSNERARQYRIEPAVLAVRFALSAHEPQLVRGLDVRGLMDHSVNRWDRQLLPWKQLTPWEAQGIA